MDREAHLNLIAQLRGRVRQTETELIARNESIATLERRGHDAREARARRAQLWLSQEADLAEIERLEELGRYESQTPRQD